MCITGAKGKLARLVCIGVVNLIQTKVDSVIELCKLIVVSHCWESIPVLVIMQV